MTASRRPDQRRSSTGAALDWLRLILATAAKTYLVMGLTLAAIAFLPMALGWQATVVQTGSMQPHIDPGDVAVTAPWSLASPIPLGGVITYTSPATAEADGVQRQRLHRIVSANDNGTYTTAGDANANVDSTPLAREQITGQARLLVPHIGLPSLWLGTGKFSTFGAWAVLTMLALWMVYRTPDPDDVEKLAVAPTRNDDGATADDADPPASDDDSDVGSDTDGGATPEPVPEDDAEFDTASVAGHPSRRIAMGLLGATSLAVLALDSAPASTAAFTARTATAGSTWAYGGPPVPSLGRASSYRLLARTALKNVPPLLFWTTQVTGSIGTSPSGSIDGFFNSMFLNNVSGSIDRNTSSASSAMGDAQTLYATLGKQPTSQVLGAELSRTLGPGTYQARTLTVQSVTLDARGDSSARFVIRADSLSVAQNATMTLRGGADAANVYWCTSQDITLGAGSTSRGTFLANRNVTLRDAVFVGDGALYGRAIALGGTIEVDRFTISG